MPEITSKELVRGLFGLRELPRTPFIPWVCTFAAQLEQVPIEDMLSDPGLLSSSLLNAQELFGYDAIATVFDTTLEAQACGCEIEWQDNSLPKIVTHPLEGDAGLDSLNTQDVERQGRIPVVLEAIKRTKAVRGKDVAIFGVVTGPLQLASQLKGENLLAELDHGSEEAAKIVTAAASFSLRLVRKYCEAGIDALVVADEVLGQTGPGALTMLAGPLKSIWNVTRFFGVRSLILTPACGAEVVDPILDLRAEGVALGPKVDGDLVAEAALKRNCCYGVSIDVAQTSSEANAPVSDRRRGRFLTTHWELPYDTDVHAMHTSMANIRK